MTKPAIGKVGTKFILPSSVKPTKDQVKKVTQIKKDIKQKETEKEKAKQAKNKVKADKRGQKAYASASKQFNKILL